MQFASSGPLEDVQAYVASVVAKHGGVVRTQTSSVTSAAFPKRWRWRYAVLLLVWFFIRDGALTVTYRVADGVVYGGMVADKRAARRAMREIANAFIT